MKLPIIKSLVEFGNSNSKDDIAKTIEVLEHVSQSRGLKPEEVDVIGELLSNMYGAIEVSSLVATGVPQTEALNQFMKRVMGSIN